MSFNQYRTNPGQAVSNFKGRTETSKAWPGTAVSTWMNGGLFGSASTPEWEILSAFNLVNNSYDIDISALKADYAAVKFVWMGQAQNNNSNYYVNFRAFNGSSPQYHSDGRSVGFASYGTTNIAVVAPTPAYYWGGASQMKRGQEVTFWGLADQPSSSWGEAGIMHEGWNQTLTYPVVGAWKNDVAAWDRIKIFLGSTYGTIDTGQVWKTGVGSEYNRMTVWGLKAQREALS